MAPNSEVGRATESTQSTAPPPPPNTPSTSTSTPTTPSPSPSPSPPSKPIVNDPARTGFDPQTKWWLNYFRVLSGQMTPEGQFHFRESRYRVHEARDCRRCEGFRDWLFAYSPVVRFLQEKVADLGGRLDASNVVCRRCPAVLDRNDDADADAADGDGQLVVRRKSGGFSPDHGILLCANEIRDRKHLEDTLAHEMVHAWDHLRWKVDWASEKDLKHAACAEIRASMLSGECRWTREAFTRGHWTLTQQFQNCVRRRAIQSVMARPRCKSETQAAQAINQVWDSCFADTRPFDEVYR